MYISLVLRYPPNQNANQTWQATYDGHKPLTTQIFDRKDTYLDNDSVFAVKDSLVVDFVPRENDPQAGLELKYDIKLVPNDEQSNGTNGVTNGA